MTLTLRECFMLDALDQAEKKWPRVVERIRIMNNSAEPLDAVDLRSAADCSDATVDIFHLVLKAIKEGY